MQLLEFIQGFLRRLFGGPEAPGAPTPGEPSPTAPEQEPTCTLGLHELPPELDRSGIPFISMAEATAVHPGAAAAEGGALPCLVTVRPSLGVVNLRSGPRLGFFPVGTTLGGTSFPLAGASERDEGGFRWYQVSLPPGFGGGTGWIRGDLVTLSEACREYSFITDADYPPLPTPPPPGQRFPLPAEARITWGYNPRNHPGIDQATVVGTPIGAATRGTVIRRVTCENCTPSRPNIFPCSGAIYNDPAWGYGYGNFVVVRHDYDILPDPLRTHMYGAGLAGGFAYVLYAHFSRLDVDYGQTVNADDVLGLTGNHGCSTGPHLHFEVRIGSVEIVDGMWLQQAAVNPDLMFTV